MNEFVADFKGWATEPFSEDMPLSHWFLFIGLLLVLALVWNIILYHLIEALKG